MASPTRYEYEALEQNEIRLLDLLPGTYEDDIKIHLYRHHLRPPSTCNARLTIDDMQKTLPTDWEAHQNPEGRWFFQDQKDDQVAALTYEHPSDANWPHENVQSDDNGHDTDFEALSYVWGTKDNPDKAFVYSRRSERLDELEGTLDITPNLGIALRSLRKEDQTRTLWVDAVCINQNDLEERGSQVALMGYIYSSAPTVLAWLGTESADSKLGLAALQYFGQQVELSKGAYMFQARDAQELDWYLQHVQLPWTEQEWQAVIKLLDRPWFQRLWVVQEVSLARDAIVQCGDDVISYRDLRRAIYCLAEKNDIPPELYVRVSPLQEVACGGWLFGDLMYLARRQACAEPNDKVYAVASLLDDQVRQSLRPSYLDSYSKVYKDVFLSMVSRSQRIDLLVECSLAKNEYEGPSWVPDWRADPQVFPGVMRGYEACASSKAYYKYDMSSPGQLEVTGRLMDTAMTIFEPLGDDISDVAIFDYLKRIKPPASVANTYRTGEPTTDAWARTVRMDLLAERFYQTNAFPDLETWKAEFLPRIDPDSADSAAIPELPYIITKRWQSAKFFHTAHDLFGFGPIDMQAGDRIAVLLGLRCPLVLRPVSEGTFSVVGPAYVHGLMDGEAFLGDLPPGWRVEQVVAGVGGDYVTQFRNLTTGEAQTIDPRLGAENDAEVTPELLLKRGIQVQAIKLV